MITLQDLQERGWDKPFVPITLDVAVAAALSNMVPATLEHAYQKLGLLPLDDFVLTQVKENHCLNPAGDPYQQIGASTWMCVRAALAVLESNNVLIQARDTRNAVRLYEQTLQYVSQLFPVVDGKRHGSDRTWFKDPPGAVLSWHEVPDRTPDTRDADLTAQLRGVKLFNDENWKARTIRFAQGPCALTQEIRLEQGRYYGYDEDGERLLELTADGAATMAREPRHKPVKLVGFFVTVDSQPVVIDPQDMAANIFGPPDPPPVKARIVPHVPVSRILDMGGANATRGYSTSPWAPVGRPAGKKRGKHV